MNMIRLHIERHEKVLTQAERFLHGARCHSARNLPLFMHQTWEDAHGMTA
jgi:hypothetical protein